MSNINKAKFKEYCKQLEAADCMLEAQQVAKTLAWQANNTAMRDMTEGKSVDGQALLTCATYDAFMIGYWIAKEGVELTINENCICNKEEPEVVVKDYPFPSA